MKLTDNYISKIKHLDKDQFFSMPGVEGLTLQVYKHPSKSKTWFYQYRPKGKNPVRLKVGSYEELAKFMALGNRTLLTTLLHCFVWIKIKSLYVFIKFIII